MAEGSTVQTVASTGVAELHHEPTAFGINAAGWVALSMLVVIGLLLWKNVPGLVARMLDGQIEKIRSQLDEASRLRAEAEAEILNLLFNLNKHEQISKKLIYNFFFINMK